MAFSAAKYSNIYKRFMGNLAKSVTLQINNGTSFTDYPGILAYVTNYRESDIVQGGSIQVGDMKLIITHDYIPPRIETMSRKDRVKIDGRSYSVIHWDAESRSMGDTIIAVEIAVRG